MGYNLQGQLHKCGVMFDMRMRGPIIQLMTHKHTCTHTHSHTCARCSVPLKAEHINKNLNSSVSTFGKLHTLTLIKNLHDSEDPST